MSPLSPYDSSLISLLSRPSKPPFDTTTTPSSFLPLFPGACSSCARHVRIALNFKGLDYEYIAVNLLKGDLFTEGEIADMVDKPDSMAEFCIDAGFTGNFAWFINHSWGT